MFNTSKKRTKDRRSNNKDFRSVKVDRRKRQRRKVDRLNYYIYYIILVMMISIMVIWLVIDFKNILGE